MLGLTSKFCHHIKSFQFDFEDQAKPSQVSCSSGQFLRFAGDAVSTARFRVRLTTPYMYQISTMIQTRDTNYFGCSLPTPPSSRQCKKCHFQSMKQSQTKCS